MQCDPPKVMENERSLETILGEVRRKHAAQEALPPVFNQHHREFLDHLRNFQWVSSSKLPHKPRTEMALLRNEWIERRDTSAGIEYRITNIGLDAARRRR